MSPITADLSILHECLQLSFNHPSSRLFNDDHLVGSTAGVLPQIDQSLAISGIQTLLQARRKLNKGKQYLQSLLQHLSCLKDDTEALIARCRALVAPVRSLPAELLQHIFEFVRLQDDKEGVPLAIAQVCRRWRDVALSMPSLWTTIVVNLTHKNAASQVKHISRRMERTVGHPVALFVKETVLRSRDTVPRHEDTTEDPLFLAGVELARGLEPYGSRLNSFRFKTYNRSEEGALGLLSTLHASKTYCMPNLKSFSIAGISEELSVDWYALDDFLSQKAPRLERFSADGTYLGDIFNTHSTNVKQLRANFSYENITYLPGLLPQSVEVLEMGRFDDWDGFERGMTPVPGPGPSPTTFLHHLTSLSIVPTSAARIHPRDLVPLPSLRHLILTQQCFLDRRPVSVRAILKAWGSQLDFLSLVTVDNDKEPEAEAIARVEGYLKLTPRLQALRLGTGNYVQAVQNAHLPRLTHCELDFGQISTKGLACLKTFARQLKKETRPSLRTIDVWYAKILGLDDMRPAILLASNDFAASGIVVSTKEHMSGWDDYRFDGPYFERLGGVFDTLYSSDWLSPDQAPYLNC